MEYGVLTLHMDPDRAVEDWLYSLDIWNIVQSMGGRSK